MASVKEPSSHVGRNHEARFVSKLNEWILRARMEGQIGGAILDSKRQASDDIRGSHVQITVGDVAQETHSGRHRSREVVICNDAH